MESSEVLNQYLLRLRRSSGLSVEEVCLRTKIQARFVEALEAGRWGEVPSNTHLRAFSMAIAKACGGDEAQAASLARHLLAVTAPVAGAEAPGGFDTPAPSPAVARRFPASAAAEPDLQGYAPGAAGPALAVAGRASSLAAASVRMRALPLSVLLTLLAVAGALSYGAAWSLDHWRRHEVAAILAAQSASTAAASIRTSAQALASGAPAGRLPQGALQAYAAPAQGRVSATDSAAPAPNSAQAAAPVVELALRARRPCWLVLEIDGKRLPTVTMLDGDKLKWTVSQRAVLLAGNVGALRVWWQGDNDGYLGALDRRANALVFERGHEPHLDPSAALTLPQGIE